MPEACLRHDMRGSHIPSKILPLTLTLPPCLIEGMGRGNGHYVLNESASARK